MNKALLLLTIALACAVTTKAQTIINIPLEQYEPLTVMAQTVSVDIPDGGITIGSDVTIDGGDGTYYYVWTNAEGTVVGSEKTLNITTAGDYYLKVTDGHSCQVSTKFTATSASGINGIGSDKFAITIANKNVTITSSESIIQARIISTAGQMVKRFCNIMMNGNTVGISLQDIPEGAYLLCCIYKNGNASVKRIIVK